MEMQNFGAPPSQAGRQPASGGAHLSADSQASTAPDSTVCNHSPPVFPFKEQLFTPALLLALALAQSVQHVEPRDVPASRIQLLQQARKVPLF